MTTVEERAFLEAMAAKHLPGRHDQSTHGRHSAVNRAAEAARELEGLRESLARAQELMGGRPLREDHAAADRRLITERLRHRGGDTLGPSDLLERTEALASGRNRSEALQARARLQAARMELARDRATVLAKVEAQAFIDEWFDDAPASLRRSFDTARSVNKVSDDPRLAPLGQALESGDRDRVFQALQDIAADAGVTRIGGDPRQGYDQVIPYVRGRHRSISGAMQPGQMVRLVSPGYTTRNDEGNEVVLVEAAVQEVDADELRAGKGRKHLPGRHDQSRHGRRGGTGGTAGFRWISPDDAMAMRKQMLEGDPWTPQQQDALNVYTGEAYHEMNGLLRDDQDAVGELSDGEKAEFSALIRDAAAGMRPTTEPVKVKRFVAGFAAFGLNTNTMTREEMNDALRAMKGKTLQEPGFMSTSLSETYGAETWSGRVKLELDVPAGAHGAYLDGDVGFQREQELLLAPGSRFEITDVVIDPPRNTVKGRVVVP